MCLIGTADLERRPVRRAGFRAAVAVAFAGCRSLRTGLAEQAGEESCEESCEESLTLNQTTDHDGKFGELCSRPGGKRAGGANPFCYHIFV